MTAAAIHDWCGRLHDPAHDTPCPCRAQAGTRLEVQRRHRDSVRLAKQHGWAGNARRSRRGVRRAA
jgi:hypothetical protein